MSVLYQSWEVRAGPTVGYKLAPQGAHCATDGANLGRQTQQESLIRGLSALSLYAQQPQSTSEASTLDSKNDVDAFSRDSLHFSQSFSHVDMSGLTGSMALSQCSQLRIPSQRHVNEDPSFDTLSGSPPLSPNLVLLTENGKSERFHPISDRFLGLNNHLRALDVVTEEKPWEINSLADDSGETDALSLGSSINDVEEGTPCASKSTSQGELEAQSVYKDCMSSLESLLPVKKGLSRFYSGKSRSFTCLADVVSVKDIAKPENPYARKRKSFMPSNNNLDRPRLNAVRNGSGICKKPFYSNKSTLALAVAMRTKESFHDEDEHECPFHLGVFSGWENISTPPRSYSLSDLQGAGCRYSPGAF